MREQVEERGWMNTELQASQHLESREGGTKKEIKKAVHGEIGGRPDEPV